MTEENKKSPSNPTEASTGDGMGLGPEICSATKDVVAFGQPITIGCDGKCDKAWGLNNRPKKQLSENPDDYAFLSDGELEDAPINPGTYEGGYAKPLPSEPLLNKWCFRECERSCSAPRGEELTPPDYSERVFNMPKQNVLSIDTAGRIPRNLTENLEL